MTQSESLEERGPPKVDDVKSNEKKRRKRLSFSSPNAKEQPSVRRSKRLSREHDDRATTPVPKPERKAIPKQANNVSVEQRKSSPANSKKKQPTEPVVDIAPVAQTQTQPLPQFPPPQPTLEPVPPPMAQTQAQAQLQSEPESATVPTQDESHAATKIALPFADTPVIKRNKAMREGKSGKGERRSSLGFRGRRASSLIETGNSNGETGDGGFTNS